MIVFLMLVPMSMVASESFTNTSNETLRNVLRAIPDDVFASYLPDVDESGFTVSGEPTDFFSAALTIPITPATSDTINPWFPTMTFTTLATWDIGTNIWVKPQAPSIPIYTPVDDDLSTSREHWWTSKPTKTLINRNTPDLYQLFTRTATPTTKTTTTSKSRTKKYTTRSSTPVMYNAMVPGLLVDKDQVDIVDDQYGDRTTTTSDTLNSLSDHRKMIYIRSSANPRKKHSNRHHTTKGHAMTQVPTIKHNIKRIKHRKRTASLTFSTFRYTPKIIQELTRSDIITTKVKTMMPSSKNISNDNTIERLRNNTTSPHNNSRSFLRMKLSSHLVHHHHRQRQKYVTKTVSVTTEINDIERILKSHLYKALNTDR